MTCVMKAHLQELTTNSMLVAMFQNLSILSNICLSILVQTACVEQAFSQIKNIKARLRNQFEESCLSYLIKIAMESQEILSNDDLDKIVNIWNKNPQWIIVYGIIATFIYPFISLFIIIFKIKITWIIMGRWETL